MPGLAWPGLQHDLRYPSLYDLGVFCQEGQCQAMLLLCHLISCSARWLCSISFRRRCFLTIAVACCGFLPSGSAKIYRLSRSDVTAFVWPKSAFPPTPCPYAGIKVVSQCWISKSGAGIPGLTVGQQEAAAEADSYTSHPGVCPDCCHQKGVQPFSPIRCQSENHVQRPSVRIRLPTLMEEAKRRELPRHWLSARGFDCQSLQRPQRGE